VAPGALAGPEWEGLKNEFQKLLDKGTELETSLCKEVDHRQQSAIAKKCTTLPLGHPAFAFLRALRQTSSQLQAGISLRNGVSLATKIANLKLLDDYIRLVDAEFRTYMRTPTAQKTVLTQNIIPAYVNEAIDKLTKYIALMEQVPASPVAPGGVLLGNAGTAATLSGMRGVLDAW
jgi:hypothetical protein